jgi:hypothetical protein
VRGVRIGEIARLVDEDHPTRHRNAPRFAAAASRALSVLAKEKSMRLIGSLAGRKRRSEIPRGAALFKRAN